MRIESIAQKIIEFRMRIRKSNNYVFMFHIVDDDFLKYNNNEISISTKSFKKFVNSLIDSGITFDSIDNLQDNVRSSKTFVYFTFDDIWECSIKNALAYLELNGIPFAVFISTKFVDNDLYINSKDLFTLSQSELCTIGFHSKSHEFFKHLDSNLEQQEIDKEPLEKVTNKSISLFAYPYGSLYSCGMNRIKKTKLGCYNYAFSTLFSGINDRIFYKYRFFLPRMNVNQRNYNKIARKVIKICKKHKK